MSAIVETLLMSVLGTATLGGLRRAMVVAARSPRPAGRVTRRRTRLR
jgi:hypothetical protein